jgi:phosphatidylinositol glycan class K
MLFMIDTCQANTMYSKFYSPNILATGSSKLDQSSYSHHADNDVGVAVIDRYTYYNLEFLENNVKNASSKHTLKDLFDSYDTAKIHSDPGVRTDLFNRRLDEVLITDFFGNVQNVEVDGKGEEEKWKVDALELARLAANLTVPGRKSAATEKPPVVTEIVERSPAVRKLAVSRVEEKQSWTQSAVGISALMLCAAAWFGGAFVSK